MRFFVEMGRMGPKGHVLVTLQDGPSPAIGEIVKDEDGDAWKVCKLHPTEVELVGEKASKLMPKGRTLTLSMVHAAA